MQEKIFGGVDFLCNQQYNGNTESEVETTSPRTGRPKSENPKDIDTRIRMDKETAEKLETCAKLKSTTKSNIIREGIEIIWERLVGQEK